MSVFNEEIRLAISAKSGGAVTELDKLEKQTGKTADAWDGMAKKIGVSSQTLKTGLVAGATALVGTGLVDFLRGTADAYSDAALAANQLSRATNASTEDASRFVAVAESYGLGLNDLTEIFSDFQQAAAQSPDALRKLGVELVKGPAGMTDWIATAVKFIDTIQKIPDATERNRLMFKFFGEEGAKQLMTLAASGKSVEDQMKAIDTARVFGTKDVQAAQDYNEAMRDLAASGKAAQLALGQTLAPIVSGLSSALVPMIEILGKVPTEMYLVVGAAVALRAALSSAFVTTAVSNLAVAMTGLRAAASGAGQGIGGAFAGLARSAGPMLLLVGAITAVVKAVQNAADIKARATDIDSTTASLRAQAEQLVKTDSIWNTLLIGNDVDKAMSQIAHQTENAAEAALNSSESTDAQRAAAQKLLDVLGDGTQEQKTNNLATEEGRQAQEAFALSLGASDKAAADSAKAQKNLADLIAGGQYTQEQYATAVRAAAAAQLTNATNTKAAKDAVDGLLASTANLWETTLSLIDAEDAQTAAHQAYKDALAAVGQAEKDASKEAGNRADAAKAQADAVKKAQAAVSEARAADEKGSTKATRDALKRANEALEDARADQAKGAKARADESEESQKRQTRAAKDTEKAVVDAARNQADADVKAAQAQALIEGKTLDTATAHDIYLESLKKAKGEADTKEQRDEIQKLIDKLKEAQERAGEGIEIGGIRWKSGTTKKQLDEMNKAVSDALAAGNAPLAHELQSKIDALQNSMKSIPPGSIPVNLVGPDGKPLNEPQTTNIVPTVTPESVDATQATLTGLTGDREAKINAVVHNQQNTINVLDGLAGDREMTITVHYKVAPGETAPAGVEGPVRRATSSVGLLLSGPSAQAMSATQPVPVAGQQFGGGATFQATVVNNYPAPERASDSIAASLRVARYALGLT